MVTKETFVHLSNMGDCLARMSQIDNELKELDNQKHELNRKKVRIIGQVITQKFTKFYNLTGILFQDIRKSLSYFCKNGAIFRYF